jgi:hypothetical protein
MSVTEAEVSGYWEIQKSIRVGAGMVVSAQCETAHRPCRRF